MSFDFTFEGNPPPGVPSGPALGVDTTTGTLYVSTSRTGAWTKAGGSATQLSSGGNTVTVGGSPVSIALTDSAGDAISFIPSADAIELLSATGAEIAVFSNGALVSDAAGNGLEVGGGTTKIDLTAANNRDGMVVNSSGNTVIQGENAVTLESHNSSNAVVIGDGSAGFYNGTSVTGTLLLHNSTTFGSVLSGDLALSGNTATTVGAAGAASALPATPAGYWIINVGGNVGGTQFKIPYYNTSRKHNDR